MRRDQQRNLRWSNREKGGTPGMLEEGGSDCVDAAGEGDRGVYCPSPDTCE